MDSLIKRVHLLLNIGFNIVLYLILHVMLHCQCTCHLQDPHGELCNLCAAWKHEIWAQHTAKRSVVYWNNCTPHLWPSHKWEVAKVCSPQNTWMYVFYRARSFLVCFWLSCLYLGLPAQANCCLYVFSVIITCTVLWFHANSSKRILACFDLYNTYLLHVTVFVWVRFFSSR